MTEPYNNYQNKFIQLAGLEIPGLPETLDISQGRFLRKPEFHITLLAVERVAGLIDGDKVESLKPAIADEFYKFVGGQPLTEYELSDDVRLVEVDGNKTIVVMAALEGIEALFARLSELHQTELPVQPTHVTLYTLPEDRFGIPINSYEELASISQPLNLPEIQIPQASSS